MVSYQLAGLGKSQDISEYTEHWSKQHPKSHASRKHIKQVLRTIWTNKLL